MKEYLDATVPELAFGEYWDTCEYTDGVLNYNQDAHRQRTVNWCDRTGGTSAAFDFTTKGARGAPGGSLKGFFRFCKKTCHIWYLQNSHVPTAHAYLDN